MRLAFRLRYVGRNLPGSFSLPIDQAGCNVTTIRGVSRASRTSSEQGTPMKTWLMLTLIALMLNAATIHAAQQFPFDNAYTVGSFGSTTPVNSFSILGSAPVLFLDLPGPHGQYSYGSSNWFFGSGAPAQFSANSNTVFASAGQYWLSPAPDVWGQKKSIGDWTINANYGWWDLAMIYGVGAPLTQSTGAQTVSFTVTPNPEPSSMALLVLGFASWVTVRNRTTGG
jgi:hypothetical protein